MLEKLFILQGKVYIVDVEHGEECCNKVIQLRLVVVVLSSQKPESLVGDGIDQDVEQLDR